MMHPTTIEDIKSYLDTQEQIIISLRQENKNLREYSLSNANKEFLEENKRLKEKLSLVIDAFNSKKEQDAYFDFCQQHSKHIELADKSIIVKTYPFGGLGVGHKVVCLACGAEEDITDISVM